MQNSDRYHSDRPVKPFRFDCDGDIVDANGWLICCPARGVWDSDEGHGKALLDVLNWWFDAVE